MYWFRTETAWGLLAWVALPLAWWLGGWLLAQRAFKLERGEALIAGFGLGLALFSWLANLFGYFLPVRGAFYLGALVPLVAGLVLAWRGERPFLPRVDRPVWGLLLLWGAGSIIFLKISQGVAIFDEYFHLPLLSSIAAGNLPPQNVFNPGANLAYHYGFHFLGASLINLGGLFPWSAFDLSKAILWGYVLALAVLVGRRYVAHPWGGWWVAAVAAFATGTRYLLLLASTGFLSELDRLLKFQGDEALSGEAFSHLLSGPWLVGGGPPVPFMFAFIGGTMEPLILAHAGINILNLALLFLTWLLVGRGTGRVSFLLFAVVFAFWAMTYETTYAVLAIGAVALAFWPLRGRYKDGLSGFIRQFNPETGAILVSACLALVQGGLITEIFRQFLEGGETGVSYVAGGVAGFGLRAAPAVVSKHLGALGIFSPPTLLLALFELGPVIFFAGWVTRWAWRRFQGGDWFLGVLILSAWVGFLFPMLFTYQSEPDLARLVGHAMLSWSLILCLMVFDVNLRPLLRRAAVWALALAMVGGLVTAGVSLMATSQTVLSEGIDKLDAEIARQWWGRMPPGIVFDPRAVTLTGSLTHISDSALSFGFRSHRPPWLDALETQPTLAGFLAQDFSFVYVDEIWWKSLPDESRASLSNPCIQTLAEVFDNSGKRFRRMLDLRACP